MHCVSDIYAASELIDWSSMVLRLHQHSKGYTGDRKRVDMKYNEASWIKRESRNDALLTDRFTT